MSFITNPAQPCLIVIKNEKGKVNLMLRAPGLDFMTIGGIVDALTLAKRLNAGQSLNKALDTTIKDLNAHNSKLMNQQMIVKPSDYLKEALQARFMVTINFKTESVDLSKLVIATGTGETMMLFDGLNAGIAQQHKQDKKTELAKMTVAGVNYPVGQKNINAVSFKDFQQMIATIFQAEGKSDSPDFLNCGAIVFVNKKEPDLGWFFLNRGLQRAKK